MQARGTGLEPAPGQRGVSRALSYPPGSQHLLKNKGDNPAQKTREKESQCPARLGGQEPRAPGSAYPAALPERARQVPAPSLNPKPGCSKSAVRAPESPTRQRPGFPLDPLPTVLPDDIMALDKTLSFKSTFYPNG